MRSTALFLALASLAAQPLSAHAGGCYRQRVYYKQRIVVPYAVPVAVPVAVPSYINYGAYAVPAQIAVPQQAVHQSTYQETSVEYREFLGLLRGYMQIRAEFAAQEQRPVGGQVLIQGTFQGVAGTGGGVDPGGGVPPPPGGPPPGGQDAAIQESANRSCTSCHSPTKLDGGLDLSNVSLLTSDQRRNAAIQVHLGKMPKGGTPLPDAEAQAWMEWSVGQPSQPQGQ